MIMKNIAPDIVRQRLLVEGYFTIDINPDVIERFLVGVAEHLELKAYKSPRIFSPIDKGKPGNEGYDAFMPLIDSGISVYIWTAKKFFSIVYYTCKEFDVGKAVKFTEDFFESDRQVEYLSF
jgi:S-adenosylmethionine decarboxylase